MQLLTEVATYAERALLHSYQLVTVPTYAQLFSCNNQMIRLHVHEVKPSCCMCNKSQVHESHINWFFVNVHVYGTLSISGATFCECEFSTLCALWKVNHTPEL